MLACCNGTMPIVTMLLEYGADATCVDSVSGRREDAEMDGNTDGHVGDGCGYG